MSEWKSRKFWSEVTIEKGDAGWTVLLDGRPIRAPSTTPLAVPTEPLARMIADEWHAQDDVIRPDLMPATRRANTAIDKVRPHWDGVVDVIAAYGATDLLCYRAEGPDALMVQQTELWDPVLDWAGRVLGARLSVTTGVMPVAQDPANLARLRRELDAMDVFGLTAMHDLASLTGSLLIALAVGRGALSPDRAWTLSRLDEDWQISLWGKDEEAEAAAANRRDDFLHAESFFRAVQVAET